MAALTSCGGDNDNDNENSGETPTRLGPATETDVNAPQQLGSLAPPADADSPAPPAQFSGNVGRPNTSGLGVPEPLTGSLAAVARADGSLTQDPLSFDNELSSFNVATLLTAEFGVYAATTTFYCSSTDPENLDTGNGSITMTTDDQDPPGKSIGDSVTETFDNCTQFGHTTNGTRTSRVIDVTGTPYVSAPWTLEMARTTDLTITTASEQIRDQSTANVSTSSQDGVGTQRHVVGSATIATTDASGTTTRTRVFDITTTTDFATFTSTKVFDVASTATDGASRNIKTVTPLVGGFGGAPVSGVIEIHDQNPTTNLNQLIRITAQSLGFALVETDNNGDGVIDSTTTTSWFAVIGVDVGDCFGNCEPALADTPVTIPPAFGFPGMAPQPGSGPISPIPPFTPPPGGFVPPENNIPPGGFQPPSNSVPPGGYGPPVLGVINTEPTL